MNCRLKIQTVGLLLFVATLPTLSTRYALAAGLDDKAAGDLQEAKRLYKSGRYEQAAELFSQLSSAHPDFPVFARNAGACYYYLQRAEPALSNLREYLLTQKRIAVEDRTEVEGWISEMEKLRNQNAPLPGPTRGASPGTVQSGDPGHPPSSASRAPSSGATPHDNGGVAVPSPAAGPAGSGYGFPATSAPRPVAIPTPPAAPPGDPGFSLQGYGVPAGSPVAANPPAGYGYRQGYPAASGPGQQPYLGQSSASSAYPSPVHAEPVATASTVDGQQSPAANNNTAWLVGGLGVAVLATGGVFTYLSQAAFSDTVKQYDSNKESSGKTYAGVAAISYAVGAAGVVTAAILVLMNQHRASSSVALAPVIRPDAVGAVIHYSY